jgi:hypothetical protein
MRGAKTEREESVAAEEDGPGRKTAEQEGVKEGEPAMGSWLDDVIAAGKTKREEEHAKAEETAKQRAARRELVSSLYNAVQEAAALYNKGVGAQALIFTVDQRQNGFSLQAADPRPIRIGIRVSFNETTYTLTSMPVDLAFDRAHPEAMKAFRQSYQLVAEAGKEGFKPYELVKEAGESRLKPSQASVPTEKVVERLMSPLLKVLTSP